MFNSLTWKVFFSAILFASAAYYSITVLLLYSKDLITWAKARFNPAPPPFSRETNSLTNFMGEVNVQQESMAQKVSSVQGEEIAIASADALQESIQQPVQIVESKSNDQLLVGSVADLLEEIKTLVGLVVEYNSSQAETAEFFHALFIRYPQLLGTSYQQAISLYLHDAARQFSFEVSLSEITAWWTTSSKSLK
ncbi:hypothetical protein [Chryseolinea lacunae]|uniref:DUF4760 domain-containing protein n=1 Tax=Chryseolinea lacunae TaxID=2801331 RepID=A0ABS1L010_9BACT|nr:hypothetical protein [Chryseolinea lacunae]MBL0744857.1 hypothetical protein [Chryseolinea lacunae]